MDKSVLNWMLNRAVQDKASVYDYQLTNDRLIIHLSNGDVIDTKISPDTVRVNIPIRD